MPAPGENESQEDFIGRCIPIVIADGTASNQDQAVAICHSMWRGKDMASHPKPNEGEERATFMGRCIPAVVSEDGVSEDAAQQTCARIFDGASEPASSTPTPPSAGAAGKVANSMWAPNMAKLGL